MRGSKVRGNNLGVGLGCQGNVQSLPGKCGDMWKQSPTPTPTSSTWLKLVLVEFQVGVEFDNRV